MTCYSRAACVPVLVVLTTLMVSTVTEAGDIKVLSSVGIKAVVDELAPKFEQATKHKVTAVFDLASTLKTRVEGGEAFDVAILTPAQLDDLIKQGKVAASTRTVVARVGLGLMVRAGSPPLDVGTVDAFKRTLLAATSITYIPAGASGVAFAATVDRLGIAGALKAKTRLAASGEEVNTSITSGAAQIAILPVSEILPVRGAALGGTFPADVQTYITMAAGVAAQSAQAAAARDFVAFLTAPANAAVIKAKGMER